MFQGSASGTNAPSMALFAIVTEMRKKHCRIAFGGHRLVRPGPQKGWSARKKTKEMGGGNDARTTHARVG